MRLTELAHHAVRGAIAPGAWVVDATVGNGHDTACLAQAVGSTGRVFGFDIQAAAIEAARARLTAHPSVELIHACHGRMVMHLPVEARGRIAAVMFNLGYLPSGDRTIVTKTTTTISGLTQALAYLAPAGRVSVMTYPGHPGGEEESKAVGAFASALSPNIAVTHCHRLNSAAPAPDLFVFERQR